MTNIALLPSAGAIAFRSIQRFVATHLEDLSDASLLLGGPDAQRRFRRLVSRLRNASHLDTNLCRELRWLHGLLTLELVGDPDATDPTYYCEIDPDDPVVADLCILADAVTDVLFALPVHPSTVATSEDPKLPRDAA